MNREILRFLTTLILGISISLFAYKALPLFSENSVLDKFPSLFTEYLFPLLMGLVISLQLFSFLRKRNKESPQTFRYITIIGEPRSGKTTLITSLLKALFETKLKTKGTKLYIKGKKTISYYNENISRLEKGIPLEKTEDQNTTTVFIDVEKPAFLGAKYSKMLIGDFPGEKSDSLVNEKSEFLRNDKNFSTWIEQADAYVYVIDVARYLLEGKKYTADSKAYIRSSWQTILELNSHKRRSMKYKPLVLIFNKSDLIYRQLQNENPEKLDIISLGLKSEKLPEKIDLEKLDEEFVFKKLTEDYEDLISYFYDQSVNFEKVYLSSFLTINKTLLGIQKLYNSTIEKLN